jgi:Ca2+-binding EF-hand superfamily protein
MKKILFIVSIFAFAIGIHAKPENDGKKPSRGEGRPSREDIIKKFDKDGDGKLNEEEKAELKKKMSEKGRKLPPFLVKKFDKDGDGELSEKERAEARKSMEGRRKEMIAKFDKDGDGKLNDEERKAAMASRPKPGEGKKPEGKEKKEKMGKRRKERNKPPKLFKCIKNASLERHFCLYLKYISEYTSPQARLILIKRDE